MSFRFDQYDNSIVIDGWEKGVAVSPHAGISNIQNCNIISVPGEASVGFATSLLSIGTGTYVNGTVTSVSGNTVSFATGFVPATGTAISFSNVASYTGLVTGTTVYWLTSASGQTANVSDQYGNAHTVTITGSGNASFTVYNVGQPTYFTKTNPTTGALRNYYMLDNLGQVWILNTTANAKFIYAGNSGHLAGDTQSGNGLVCYTGSDGAQWIFVFSNRAIDYVKDNSLNLQWVYGWRPSTAAINSTQYDLNASNNSFSHEALVGQDNTVYYCDTNYVGSFFEKPGQTFNPQSTSTYTFNAKALALPAIDNANCLAELGITLLVGGQLNLIYPWDRTSPTFRYPIWLTENVVAKMITVNTLTYIFNGQRGRIYVTNGSNVQLVKKVPDHISGTVEPYFIWGGVTYNKNNIYFSAQVYNNAQTALSGYGGVWALNPDTGSLRLINQLSYGTYLGVASAMIAVVPAVNDTALASLAPAGTGLYLGWVSGATPNFYGIDGTSSSPYTNSMAVIETDLIPIGTYDKSANGQRLEYLLTKPLVAGESINIYSRTDFSQSYNTVATLSDSTVGDYALSAAVDFKNVQWIQYKIVLNSTATNPSYVRLKHIRITGITGFMPSPNQITVTTGA